MKLRHYHLIFLLFIQVPLYSQNYVLNGGFEVWDTTIPIPEYWICKCISAGFCSKAPNNRTTDANSGQYALEITNIICSEGDHVGNLHSYYGKPSNPAKTTPHSFGIPLKIKPTEFSFFHKFLPTGVDSAVVSFTLFQYDSTAINSNELFDTIAFSEIILKDIQKTYVQKKNAIHYIHQIDTSRELFMNIDFTIQGQYESTKLFIDDVKIAEIDGSTNNALGNNYILYPNPATSHVQITSFDQELKKIRLFDIKGREIIFPIIKNDENIYFVDISKIANGIYLIVLESEFSSQTVRLIID